MFVMPQMFHLIMQFMFKYRVRCCLMMTWIMSWIRRWSCRHWHWRRNRRIVVMMMVMNRIWLSWSNDRIIWINMNGWEANRRSSLINCDVSNRASSRDRDVLSQVQWQSMLESAVMLIVNCDSILRMFSSDRDLKGLMSLNWISTMTFFSSKVLILHMISNNHILLRTNADVQHSIIARLQSCSTLNVYLETK